MVIAKDEAVFRRACHLKNQGVSTTREYWHDVLAFNYRMTNICAAIGLAQIERADSIIAKKRQIAQWYKAGLANLPLRMHDEQPGTTHSFWMCSIAVDDPAARQPLRDHLKAAGIETRPVFYPSHTLPHCATEGSFPTASSLASRGINLPSFPDLTEGQVVDICREITQFFE
ncbi:GDP-perosamine synthase [compost metagenome]